MKNQKLLNQILFVLLLCLTVFADRYVSLDGANQIPYTSWATAATNIQIGIDAAGLGETIFVSNGIYKTGETFLYGLSNRIAVMKQVEVRSIGGPNSTFIHGSGLSLGINPVRCAILTNGAKLVGFTLYSGNTKSNESNFLVDSGGGALLLNGGTLENCRVGYCNAGTGGGVYLFLNGDIEKSIIERNSAQLHGGGAYFQIGGNIRNSSVRYNSADQFAGGLGFLGLSNIVDNCVVKGNSSTLGGGGIVAQSGSGIYKNLEIFDNNTDGKGGGILFFGGNYTLCNSKIYDNSAPQSSGGGIGNINHGVTLNRIINCTVAHNSATNGGGIYTEGGCTSINSIISFNTAVAGGNNWLLSGTGNDFENCYTTPDPGGTANIIGSNPEFVSSSARNYHLRDISPCLNNGNNSFVTNSFDFEGNKRIIQTIVDMGCYEFIPETPGTPVHYASTTGGNIQPYTNWTTAANNIQSAINAAQAGDTVIVRAGVYDKGFGESPDSHRNRVMLNKDVNLESESGKDNTIIVGSLPATMPGVRCAYLTNNAQIINLTLSNGVANAYGGGCYFDYGGIVSGCDIKNCYSAANGGGIFIRKKGEIKNSSIFNNISYLFSGGIECFDNSVITNCDVYNNYAEVSAGGIGLMGGIVTYSRIFNNSSRFDSGGIACYASGTVENCEIYGNYSELVGGIGCWFGGIVKNCEIYGNTADNVAGGNCYGGGVFENCLVFNNSTTNNAGGIKIQNLSGKEIGIVRNCTIVNNNADQSGGGIEIISSGIVQNTIVYLNSAGVSGENWSVKDSGATIEYSCLLPAAAGTGNITNYPDFVDSGAENFHLPGFSPCVDAGTNLPWMTGTTDLDGNERIHDGTVDMGCYEFIPEPGFYLLFIIGNMILLKIKFKINKNNHL